MTDIPERYGSTSREQAAAHIIEECGEVLAAGGKAIRFGWQAVNPEIPVSDQETNLDWFERELKDLERAIEAYWLQKEDSNG